MDALLKLAVQMVGLMAQHLQFLSFKIPIGCDCGSADHVTFLSGIRGQSIWPAPFSGIGAQPRPATAFIFDGLFSDRLCRK